MSDVVRDLSDLLDRERAAALRADVEALEALQDDKRALLERARGADVSANDPALVRLAATARANIALIRQLATLQRALLGLDASGGYGAHGEEVAPHAPRLARGVL
ncbi:MAG TPA: hypothetical protein RMH99_28430 [Sandaracinaceae bacterium LLY-WYZ-13_1]|nr:hypothetical protein [Sandaracinaceae bacterium LLY-WYZ-13_1]